MCRLNNWPTKQNQGDTNDDWFTPNNIKTNRKVEKKKPKNVDVVEKIYNFSIINTKSKHYKYVLSKQLEEVDPKKRYYGKYIYPINQFVFLFQKNNKIIVPIKMFVKKKLE